MSKKESIMKMPESVKLVSTVEDEMVTDDGSTMLTAISVNWILTTAMIAGVIVIPPTSLFILIPAVLGVIVSASALLTGVSAIFEQVSSVITERLKALSGLGVSQSHSSSLNRVKISYWSNSSAATLAHFFLPLRIFKRVRLHESVTYSPQQDVYVKETYYLTSRKVLSVQETFEGSRAVFNKAIDSF